MLKMHGRCAKLAGIFFVLGRICGGLISEVGLGERICPGLVGHNEVFAGDR